MLDFSTDELKLLVVTLRDYQLALLRSANHERDPVAALAIRKDAATLSGVADKVDAELLTREPSCTTF